MSVSGCKVLGIVPARGGSKGIPRKNLAIIKGKSLVRRAVEVGLNCALIDKVIISTDDVDIAEAAIQAGATAPFMRPAHLAGDQVKTIDAVLHLLDNIDEQPEIIVLLQPTAPVRNVGQLTEVVQMLKANPEVDAVVSVVQLQEPHPMKVKAVENGFLVPYIKGGDSECPRQQLPMAFKLNGAFYAVRKEALIRERTFLPHRTKPYVMPEETGINIDAPLDLVFLECCLEHGVIHLD